jgi:hypothetical protein
MSTKEIQGYVFVCPEGRESLAVNGPMRDALVGSGCVLCATTVTRDAFTRTR